MDMSTTNGTPESVRAANAEYEAPELTVIGKASEVVLGVATGGFDGVFQMTEAAFEFERDDNQP
jgi:hypothetical protein